MSAKLKKAIMGMCVAFNRTPEPLVLQVYLDQLAHVSEDRAVAAVNRAIAECQFWPVPAVVRQFADGTAKDDLAGRAAHAWARVDEAVRRVGSYGTPDFSDDPDIARAVHLCGGWVAICQTDEDQWDWKRKEFMAHFERVRRSGDSFACELRGIHGDTRTIGAGVNPRLLDAARKNLTDKENA
jgi:hypothetical protein